MLKKKEENFPVTGEPLRQLIELSPIPFFTADSKGILLSVNQPAHRFFGFEPGELTGKYVPDLVHSDDREEFIEFIEKPRPAGETGKKIRFNRRDGISVPCEIQVNFYSDEVWLAALTDLSSVENLEGRLQISEKSFQAVAENSNAAIICVDKNKKIVRFNRGAETIFEHRSEDVIGHPLSELFSAEQEQLPFFRPPAVSRDDRNSPAHRPVEISAKRADGEIFQLELSISPDLRFEDGSQIFIARDISNYRKTEKQTAHLAAIVEDSEDAIISKDLNGIIASWNAGAENLFGYTADEMIGRSVTLLMPPQFLNEEQLILERIKKGEKIETFETLRRCKDGKFVEISLTVSPIKDSHGNVIGASKIARNISERKRTEKELRESQMMLALAMKSSRMGVWEHNIQTGVVHWSPELEEIFGLKKGEFARTRPAFYEMIHEDDRDNVFQAVESAIRENRDYVLEFRFLHKDGSIRWMEGRGQALYSDDGLPVRVYGSGIDITERKIGEERIMESEKLFRTMADNISQFAWMADENGSVFWYNRRWFEYTGTTLEEMRGWGWKKVHHPDHVNRVAKKIQKSWDTGEIWEDTFPLRGRDGTYRWFLSRALPIRDEAGKVFRWFGTNTDITDRKDAEEALLAANRSKDEFLSVLSHELRTPLNSILGWIRMLRSGELDEPKISKALRTIERNARLQSNLIEDLLDVSRIISGKMHIEIQEVDIVSTIKTSIESVKPLAEANEVRLGFDSRIESVIIMGDQTKLIQILVNLLNNSIKFTPSGGLVKISVSAADSRAWIEVSDTGIGISEEFLPHIFDRFRQADSTIQRNYSGLGLGLTIVKHLTELHGGSIAAASDGKGKGARFTLELPVAGEKSTGADSFSQKVIFDKRREERLFLQTKKILLVDDDCDGIEPVQILLESYGATIVCVDSAEAALSALTENSFDLIISDIGMPKMNGYQLIDEIIKLKGRKCPPAIALTAFAGVEDRRRALAAGFSFHLPKPIDYEALVKITRQLVESA